ncbi:MAG: hypothetical protein JWQ97_3625 [Phenylobacterium sp.]|nr:hypothetical protein [Phenylobacterium sp.]
MPQINVARRFNLLLALNATPVRFEPGVHEVSDEVAEHWYTREHLVAEPVAEMGDDTILGGSGEGAATVPPSDKKQRRARTPKAETAPAGLAGEAASEPEAQEPVQQPAEAPAEEPAAEDVTAEEEAAAPETVAEA